ncbi:hypothetical protein [Rhodoplanes roseus]|uniref:Uncharacterized protein n=1 Tax=Rhodoplanes roseus TaxID=29409 RepID=A0A327KKX4_9BRAD|nr:hypothetical protein [Rhodoplanes roseus]RAI38891.1 hypothetical protein CH341_27010 [Rhodoplanes roseus]
MGEHDTGERGAGRDGIDPTHEAFPDDAAAISAHAAQAASEQPLSGQPAADHSTSQPRLPKPDAATRAGAGGEAHAYEIVDAPRASRRGGVTPAAPAVEHDGWRAGDTIDVDETPRRRFSFQVPPYMKVAAVIAVATSFGALAGTFAATHVGSEPAAPAVVRVASDDGALKATVAELQRDVTGLRTSLENSTKALQTQTAKLADRMERAERAQAEPAQKLGKLSEAIERLERRTAQAASASSQSAGPGQPPTTLQAQAAAQGGQPTTVQASSAQAAAPPPAPMPTAPVAVASADMTASLGDPRPPAPQVVNGWVVRDVRRGIALLEGRYGYVEVETGDSIPGVGRVEGIRKQDGRWIVVTSRGLIVAR